MSFSEPATPTTRREHLQAVLLALLCSLLFLRDGVSPDRALVPHPPEVFDVHMAEAKANGTFDPADALRGNVAMKDKYLQSLCWDRVMQDRLRSGEFPRWTRDIAGGAPFVPQMAQPYQPINLLLYLLPSAGWYGIWYLLHQVLFGWFAYLFLRRIGCQHGAALLGLVAAVLGMWTQCKLHHNVILTAALSLWPMLSATHALVHEGVRGRQRRRWIGWLGLWTGLSWSTGFVPVALQASYLTGAWAVLGAFGAPRGDRLRRILTWGIGIGIGGVLSLANMLPILFASAVSARASTFAAEGTGIELAHALTLGWPTLLSWPEVPFYPSANDPLLLDTRIPFAQLVLLAHPLRTGDHSGYQSWVETSFAIGVVPFAAACTALCARRHRRTAALFGLVALFAFGMATTAEPFFSLARVLPGLMAGDLRRLLFLVAMPLVVLAGLGADVWLRDGVRWPGRAVLSAIALLSAAALGWLVLNRADADFVRGYAALFCLDADHPDVQAVGGDAELLAQHALRLARPGEVADNQRMLQQAAFWGLMAALAGIAALRRGFRWPVPTMLTTTALELLVLGSGPVQTVPIERVTTPPKVLQPVMLAAQADRPRPRLQRLVPSGRVTSCLPGNIPGFYGLEDANSYNPLPPARCEQFFGCIEPGVGYGGAGVGSFRDPASLQHPLCDLFGIRYILTRVDPLELKGVVDVTPAGTGGFHLLERKGVLPRATFVRTVDLIADEAARLTALRRPDRDVAHRVVLETDDAPRPAAADAATATVDVTLHRDERVVVRVTCSHDGYLRLADPYDAGWRACVDGEEVPIYVADHYLRAVYLEPGEHEVVFTYDGARVVWPPRVSLLAWLCVLACLLPFGRRRS